MRISRTLLRSLPVVLALGALGPWLGAQEVRLLRSNNAALWGDSLGLREELRIGSLLGEEQYTFGAVVGVTVALDSTVWVADGQAGLIRRYTWDGSYIGDVGRKGEGPGEFKYLLTLRTLQDGRIAVWDPLNMRIHLYRPDGSFDSGFRVHVKGVLAGQDLQELEVDRSGNFYAIDTSLSDDTGRPDGMFWIRLSPQGVISDSLPAALSEREGTFHGIRTFTAISPFGHLVFGRNSDYTFWWNDARGVEHRLERDYKPVSYSRAERREAQALERGYSERNGQPERALPDTKPPWGSFQVDLDGRLWVRRYVAGQPVQESDGEREARLKYDGIERTWSEPVTFDVINPDGQFLGAVTFPNSARATPTPRVEIVRATGRTVWAVERGEYDEPYVVRYRIESKP